jgi:hypothetical protein
LSEQTGEETRQIKVLLTQSQYDYVMSQPEGASSYIRYLIELSKAVRQRSEEGEDAVSGSEMTERIRKVKDELDDQLGEIPDEG